MDLKTLKNNIVSPFFIKDVKMSIVSTPIVFINNATSFFEALLAMLKPMSIYAPRIIVVADSIYLRIFLCMILAKLCGFTSILYTTIINI